MTRRALYHRHRIPELDLLRGLAIILVLLRHYPVYPAFLQGWIGVDMFFTLSGFLIGGLMLREYESTGGFRPGRFLIRRGLKIYPSFYAFLILTVLMAGVAASVGKPLFWPTLSRKPLLVEVFYLQPFGGGTWRHTWSLAIEEHFYLLLTGVVVVLVRFGAFRRNLMVVSLLSIPACVGARWWMCARFSEFEYIPLYTNTFLRLDSLFFGVALAVWYFSARDRWRQRPLWIWMALITGSVLALLLWLSHVPLEDLATVRYGYSLIYVSVGAVIVGLMGIRTHVSWTDSRMVQRNVLFRGMTSLGRHSYNIYLWHVMVMQVMMLGVHKYLGESFFGSTNFAFFAVYFIASAGIGMLASHLVEIPVLQWRDRRIPAASPINE